MCGEPRSKHTLIQKRPEIKFKKNKFFLNESKEQQLNLKRTEIITRMRGSPPPNNLLFTLK